MPKRGTRPGEVFETSLVTVWPEDSVPERQRTTVAYEDDVTGLGVRVEKPTYFIIEMRRLGTGRFRTQVLEAQPLDGGMLPEEVLDRMMDLRERIIHKQASERARLQAEIRKADGVDPFARRDEAAD